MARIGFCGAAYQSQSVNADAQKCLNFFYERLESGDGKSPGILVGTPGLKAFCTLPGVSAAAPVRGEIYANGRFFVVCGNKLFEVDATGAATALATVVDDGLPAGMAFSNVQLLVASGGLLTLVTFAGTVVQSIPAATIQNVSQVGYLDGYFVATLKNSNQFQLSGLLDGATWNGTLKAAVSVFGDNIVSMVIDHREVFLAGAKQSATYFDSGNTFPLDVIPAGFVEEGSSATWAAVKMDNTYFWISGSERGARKAYRAQGYTPQRVSTHAIEAEWDTYATVEDAVAYSYEDGGHEFWVIYFPTANKTWCYDAATAGWHERGYLESDGTVSAHLSRCHAYAFGKHIVGSRKGPKLYEMAMPQADGSGGWNFVSDDGNAIRRVRRTPHVTGPVELIYGDVLRIDVEAGLGTMPPLYAEDGVTPRGPMMMLRWSDTDTHTWSNEYPRDCGQAGQYKTAVRWRRLGSWDGTIGRIFEVAVTDAVPWRICDADLIADGYGGRVGRIADEAKARA